MIVWIFDLLEFVLVLGLWKEKCLEVVFSMIFVYRGWKSWEMVLGRNVGWNKSEKY